MRRRVGVLALVTTMTMLASGCTLIEEATKDPSSATTTQAPTQATTAQPSSQSPASSASSPRAGGQPASIDPNDVPVASFDPSAHQTWPDAPKAPDRQTGLTSNAKPKGFIDAPQGQGMDRYLNQRIPWEGCGQGFECGTIAVPLNWDEPDGQAITLKMKKRLARDEKKATLFINPGGPGGSGQEFVTSFDADGFPNHDIIGWDPRGSGESTPAVCANDAQMDTFNEADISPDNAQEWQALTDSQKAFAKACRDQSGALLDHVSTIDTARDLDYLRYLVGDQQLTYMGVSYGTFIGSVYAELYPKRAGRLVLDSAVNITDKDAVLQQSGFDRALKDFGDWCAKRPTSECPYGRSGDAVVKNIADWFGELDQKPVNGPDGTLTQNLGVMGVAAFLYSGEQAYESLLASIRFAREMRQTKYLALAAGFLNGKDDKGRYTAMAFAFPAIGCKDSSDRGAAAARPEWQDAERKAPVFGTYMGPGLQCSYWTAAPMPQLKLVGKGAPPILVLGATGDPATPYEQAQWMAGQLDSGVLLTWKGAGHGVYSLGNQCAKNAVRSFVNDGTAPKDGTTC